MGSTEITFNVNQLIEPEDAEKFVEIFRILIEKGALSGVRGGQAIIHFDGQGVFQGVELDYWPWRRRKTT